MMPHFQEISLSGKLPPLTLEICQTMKGEISKQIKPSCRWQKGSEQQLDNGSKPFRNLNTS
jgi:hypothetical protein